MIVASRELENDEERGMTKEKPLRILVAEGDREMLDLLKRVLARGGYEVLGVSDGRSVVQISADDGAPPDSPSDDDARSQRRSLEAMERSYIEQVLAECRGNRSRAARILGINRRTLARKMKQYEER